MKIYFVFSDSYKDLLQEAGVRILLNYNAAARSNLGGVIPSGFKSVLVDSGVFQLQTGTRAAHEVTIDGYCTWLKQQLPYHPEVDGYMAFDWDGGKGTTVERVATIRRNYLYMQEQGLNPLPVWHPTREVLQDLDFYAKQTDYIAMGGVASTGRFTMAIPIVASMRMRYPDHKFHILGLGHSILNKLSVELRPHSVDISTWNVPARFGNTIEKRPDGTLVEQHMLRDERRDGKRVSVEALKGGLSNVFLRDSLKRSIEVLMSLEDDTRVGTAPIQPILL